MRNIALLVEYDGTGLAGWQAQDQQASVAGHLQAALQRLTGEQATFACAGRTDAGVHARAQVAHFYTRSSWEARRFTTGLNHLLPAQVRVHRSRAVPMSFVPRRAACGKHYRYTILCSSQPSPLMARTAWHLRRRLQLAPMREAAAMLVGEHDFGAFRHSHCGAAHARRHMRRLQVRACRRWPQGRRILIDLFANAFCRHMCRIIVGTLVQVGAGLRPAQDCKQLLALGQRTLAGPTAPAHGLCLMRVQLGRRARPAAPPAATAG